MEKVSPIKGEIGNLSLFEWCIRWKWVFNEEYDILELLRELGGLESCHVGKRWYCPFCGFITYKTEKFGTHLLSKHPDGWYALEAYKLLPSEFQGRCILVSSTRYEYSIHDFLFELVENPNRDPESIFSDDKFLEWFFSVSRSRR